TCALPISSEGKAQRYGKTSYSPHSGYGWNGVFHYGILCFCRFVGAHRWAGTDEHTVALRVVDAPHRGPEFVVTHEWQRKSSLRPRVGPLPPIGTYHSDGMRCSLQQVTRPVGLPLFHCSNLLTDGDHRVAEPVEFSLRFRLGRLYHQRPGNGERHGRCMEAVVHQPFGDITHLDTSGLESSAIQYQLVRTTAVGTRVEHRVVVFQPRLDIVGIEDGILCSLGKTFAAHHRDVGM